MQIELDIVKDGINQERHGLPLSFGAAVCADADHLVIATIRSEDGEDRDKVIGMVDGKLYTGVHLHRRDAIRFISVSRSNTGEERHYRA